MAAAEPEPPQLKTRRTYTRASADKWMFHADYFEANRTMPHSIQMEVAQKLERHGIPLDRQKELSRDIAEMLDLHRGYYEKRRERNAQRFKQKKEQKAEPPQPPPLCRRAQFVGWLKNESIKHQRAFT
jgi:hypothetical protein